ncbi:hypothetical protein D3C85_488120 [compost metagenome]
MAEQLMQMLQPIQRRITTNSQQINTHIIQLWDDIDVPSAYQDEINLIDSAGENDVIVLDLCTDGGVLDTAALFNRALRSTAAHTVAIIGPSCSSAGSIIALSCREFILDTTSSLMLHTSSYGIRGKDVDIYEHASFSRRSLRRLFKDVYSGLLDENELEDVVKGTPFYFDAEELEERLDRLQAYREDLAAEECDSQELMQEHKTLDQMIEDAVDSAYQKLLAKFDLVEKPKPVRKVVKKEAPKEVEIEA